MKKIQVSQQQQTHLQVPTFRCPHSLFLASELFFLSFFFPLSEMQTMHFRGLIVLASFSGLWRSRPDTGVAAPLQPPLAQRPVQANKQTDKKKNNKQQQQQEQQQKSFKEAVHICNLKLAAKPQGPPARGEGRVGGGRRGRRTWHQVWSIFLHYVSFVHRCRHSLGTYVSPEPNPSP